MIHYATGFVLPKFRKCVSWDLDVCPAFGLGLSAPSSQGAIVPKFVHEVTEGELDNSVTFGRHPVVNQRVLKRAQKILDFLVICDAPLYIHEVHRASNFELPDYFGRYFAIGHYRGMN